MTITKREATDAERAEFKSYQYAKARRGRNAMPVAKTRIAHAIAIIPSGPWAGLEATFEVWRAFCAGEETQWYCILVDGYAAGTWRYSGRNLPSAMKDFENACAVFVKGGAS